MKNLNEPQIDKYRRRDASVIKLYGSTGDETCGAFAVPSLIDQYPMMIVASSDGGWDHVSVSRPNRCPNWPEMEDIKRLFFRDDEVCMQLHVAVRDHISIHPNALHIWRPQKETIPLPPSIMV